MPTVDDLEQDYTLPPGQLFACLSYIGPTDECKQKADHFAIKIRGVFATQTEAGKHAQRLQKEDPAFDIYCVEVGKWLFLPPPKDVDDTHYADQKLEELMQGYKQSQVEAAKMFADRKKDMTAGASLKPGDDNSIHYTKSDEAPVRTPGEFLEELKAAKPDAPIEELIEEANELAKKEIETRQKEREAAAAAEAEAESKE